jgi:hypothetical protein
MKNAQVFAFACHSWRTFRPMSLPITNQYPNVIADSLGKYSRLDWWTPDVMLDRRGRSNRGRGQVLTLTFDISQ